MAYVPPALRKKAQASSPDGTLGTTAKAARSHGVLPPGMAPPKSATEPIFSHADIYNHYWDPQNEGKSPADSSKNTLNASAQEPDKLKFIVLFRHANPRWESHGIIFVKSKLHILPGGERFKDEQPSEAGAISSIEPVKCEGARKENANGGGNLTREASVLTDEVPGEESLISETQGNDEQRKSSDEVGKKQSPIRVNRDPDPEPEPPYSPDLSLYPTNPIAVFEQAQGGYSVSARFRFAGYHKIASLEYLPPHSRELFQLLEQKWSTTDRRGRVRREARSADSWNRSLKQRWAVIQMKKDQEANERLAPPEIEVRDRHGDVSGKSVNELLKEMRLKG